MSITLKNIADSTGASVSTVFRVLKGTSKNMDAQKRQKIIDTAEKLGYLEKKLKSNSPQKFKIWCILASENENFSFPFFAELLSGIQSEAAAQVGKYLIEISTFNISDPVLMSQLGKESPNGVIVLGRNDPSNIAFLSSHIKYLVYVGLNPMQSMDEVVCDAKKGIKTIVDYLYSLGHESLAFIGSTYINQTVKECRFEGFLQALKDHGLTYESDWVENCLLTSKDGYFAAKELVGLSNRPTAIICANDDVAIGAVRAIEEIGLSVPGDISITGFDDINSAAYIKPSLTTITVPKQDLGRYAVRTLLDMIESRRDYHITITLPFKLIVRESTAKRKNVSDAI